MTPTEAKYYYEDKWPALNASKEEAKAALDEYSAWLDQESK